MPTCYNKYMNFKAILGLGNNDSKYKNTYHNVGHLMVDFLKEKNIFGKNIPIIKNDGFMNESGNSAVKLIKKVGGKPENLLVIHDDSDIALGEFKLSINRNSAGHRGVEDIIIKIGSKDFWRLRVGIRPKDETAKAEEFVLKKIKKEHKEILQKVFQEASFALLNEPSA